MALQASPCVALWARLEGFHKKPLTKALIELLPAFDSIILAHPDRSRIVPRDILDAEAERLLSFDES